MTLAEFRLTSLPVTVSRPLGRNDSAYLLMSFRSVSYDSLLTFAPFSNCGKSANGVPYRRGVFLLYPLETRTHWLYASRQEMPAGDTAARRSPRRSRRRLPCGNPRRGTPRASPSRKRPDLQRPYAGDVSQSRTTADSCPTRALSHLPVKQVLRDCPSSSFACSTQRIPGMASRPRARLALP